MAVTYGDVQTSLARDLTPAQQNQATQLIGWTQALIASRLGPIEDLDQALVDMAIVDVVCARLSNPDGLVSYEVAVDDGREVRRYRDSSRTALLGLLDSWWTTLAPEGTTSGAFTVTPYGAPDVG